MIVVYMNDGNILYLKQCTLEDFRKLVDEVEGWHRTITWRYHLWFRKKDIVRMEWIECKDSCNLMDKLYKNSPPSG